MLKNTLTRIGAEFLTARTQPFAGHQLAEFIRNQATENLSQALDSIASDFVCEGSAGAGNWATIPWLAVFDPTITDSATRGYYIVYLFNAQAHEVYLSLNQGATSVMSEFGEQGTQILKDRAALMRARLKNFSGRFEITSIELGSELRLPKSYEAGHALGKKYQLNSLPSEEDLRSDLQGLVEAYLSLSFQDGLNPAPEFTEIDCRPIANSSLIEERRYGLHRRIERNAKVSKDAKNFHGTVCQACGFNFEVKYGKLGRGFIEAHHLKPLADLEKGKPVSRSIKNDFAVLCSNCHSMIHRTKDPSDLAAFKARLES